MPEFVKRYLKETPRRSASNDSEIVPRLAHLKAGDVVFVREGSSPDFEGEVYVREQDSGVAIPRYVDASILSETPPAPTSAPKVEVLEVEVVKTKPKTLVLTLTGEEAEEVYQALGRRVGNTAWSVYRPLGIALGNLDPDTAA